MLSGSYGSDQTYLPLYRIRMSEEFEVEKVQEQQNPQHYLSFEQRQYYRVTIRDGIFYQCDQPMYGPYLYVLMPDNSLYAAKTSEVRNHSWLAGGEDVNAAGMLYMLYGRLITISNESGHYKPTRQVMLPALDWFANQILHYNFIFEDHSEQESGLILNGINFSLIACIQAYHVMSRIGLTHLLDFAVPLIDSANKRYDDILKEEHKDVALASDQLNEAYYTSTDQCAPITTGTLADKILHSKYSYFSCLSNFLDDSITLKSRYLGHFNKNKVRM